MGCFYKCIKMFVLRRRLDKEGVCKVVGVDRWWGMSFYRLDKQEREREREREVDSKKKILNRDMGIRKMEIFSIKKRHVNLRERERIMKKKKKGGKKKDVIRKGKCLEENLKWSENEN